MVAANTQISVLTGKTNAEKTKNLGEWIDRKRGEIFKAVPRHVTIERLQQVFLNTVRKNPAILQCTVPSILTAISEAAQFGLEIDGVLGHAYIVPFNNSRDNTKEAVLIIGYKGFIDLARRSGNIKELYTVVVYEGDYFSYSIGDDTKIEHVPNDKDPDRESKPILFVYGVCKLHGGGIQRSVWSRGRLESHMKKYSKGWKSAETSWKGRPPTKDSTWHTNFAEMARKTVIREMVNRGELPLSVEVQKIANREEYLEARESRVIDSVVVPPGSDPLDALTDELLGNPGPEQEPDPEPQEETPEEQPERNASDEQLYSKFKTALSKCKTTDAAAKVLSDYSKQTNDQAIYDLMSDLYENKCNELESKG